MKNILKELSAIWSDIVEFVASTTNQLAALLSGATREKAVTNDYGRVEFEKDKHIAGKDCPCHPGVVIYPSGDKVIDHQKIEQPIRKTGINYEPPNPSKPPDERGDRYVDIRELEEMSSLQKDEQDNEEG